MGGGGEGCGGGRVCFDSMLGCSLTTSDWTELNARLCVAMRLECPVSRCGPLGACIRIRMHVCAYTEKYCM